MAGPDKAVSMPKTTVNMTKGRRLVGRKRVSIFWPLKDWEKPVKDGGFGEKAKKQQIEEFDGEKGVMHTPPSKTTLRGGGLDQGS